MPLMRPYFIARMRLSATSLLNWLWTTSEFTVPLLAFYYIHKLVYWRWYERIGWGIQVSAVWPVARTHLALLMLTLPCWALLMACWTVARTLAPTLWFRMRSHPHNDYELVDMNQTGYRHDYRRYNAPKLQIVRLCIYTSLTLVGVWVLGTYPSPGDNRYKSIVENAVKNPKPQGYGNGEKIFIAAMFYNNENILPYWTDRMVKVIRYLGTDNVFVSVVESNSGDQTPALLEAFDAQLKDMGVARRIIVHDTSIPRPPSMDTAHPRIQFLADVRNKVLEPLVDKGSYDRVIFSNDVFVEAESVVELLHTRDGDWDMVCGIDLSFWGLYDAWVTRDRLGRLVSGLWPYFLEDSGMQAVMRDEPAPVFSCWNGIVAFRTDPLLPVHLRSGHYLSTSPLSKPLPSTHPASTQPANMTPAETPPLRFRTSAEYECFSSESFLLPYDLRRQFEMNKIYMNTRVITSYDWNYYFWFKYVTRHWLVRWWIENVENGAGMHLAKTVIGTPANIWQWDGVECQPWS